MLDVRRQPGIKRQPRPLARLSLEQRRFPTMRRAPNLAAVERFDPDHAAGVGQKRGPRANPNMAARGAREFAEPVLQAEPGSGVAIEPGPLRRGVRVVKRFGHPPHARRLVGGRHEVADVITRTVVGARFRAKFRRHVAVDGEGRRPLGPRFQRRRREDFERPFRVMASMAAAITRAPGFDGRRRPIFRFEALRFSARGDRRHGDRGQERSR